MASEECDEGEGMDVALNQELPESGAEAIEAKPSQVRLSSKLAVMPPCLRHLVAMPPS